MTFLTDVSALTFPALMSQHFLYSSAIRHLPSDLMLCCHLHMILCKYTGFGDYSSCCVANWGKWENDMAGSYMLMTGRDRKWGWTVGNSWHRGGIAPKGGRCRCRYSLTEEPAVFLLRYSQGRLCRGHQPPY